MRWIIQNNQATTTEAVAAFQGFAVKPFDGFQPAAFELLKRAGKLLLNRQAFAFAIDSPSCGRKV